MKKLIALILIAMLAVLSFAACTDENNDSENGREQGGSENTPAGGEGDSTDGDLGEEGSDTSDDGGSDTENKDDGQTKNDYSDIPEIDDPTVDFDNGWSTN